MLLTGLFNAMKFVNNFDLVFPLCNSVLLRVALWHSYYTKFLKEFTKFHKEKLSIYKMLSFSTMGFFSFFAILELNSPVVTHSIQSIIFFFIVLPHGTQINNIQFPHPY